MGGWLLDIGLFVVTTGARAGRRLARRGWTAWRLSRRLHGTREIFGKVEVLRSVSSPVTRAQVAAHRLTVEQRLEDGSWVLLFDDTLCGELVIRHDEGPVRITGPVELILPPSGEHDGAALAGPPLPIDEEDVRASEYLLRPGQRVHLLGLAARGRRRRTVRHAPYRDPPATADHRWQGQPVISHWSARELQRLVWEGAAQLPPDLRGVPRIRRPAPAPPPGPGDEP